MPRGQLWQGAFCDQIMPSIPVEKQGGVAFQLSDGFIRNMKIVEEAFDFVEPRSFGSCGG